MTIDDVVPRFTTIERVLYDRLADGRSVKIEQLFGAAFALPTKGNTNRHMQQRLGPYLRTMNLKMLEVGCRVVPHPEIKQSYVLQAFNPKVMAKLPESAAGVE